MTVVKAKREFTDRIRNLESLPKGTGCRFLVCLVDHLGHFVAKGWKRKLPTETRPDEVVIDFSL